MKDSSSKSETASDQGRYPVSTYGLHMQPRGTRDPTCVHRKKQKETHTIQRRGGLILPEDRSRSEAISKQVKGGAITKGWFSKSRK